MNQRLSTGQLAKIAMMAAVSCVLVLLIRIPFPPLPFLVYDPADVPIYITTFAFGPGAGLMVTVVVSFIQAFVLGGDGIYGFLMHTIATGLFAIVAGSFYRRKKSKKEAVVALIAGVIVTVIAMGAANYWITPLFMGATKEQVLSLMLPAILPFNLLKAGGNAIITFLIYKRISGFLHKA